MEKKINIAELLKGCPKGMKLYSPLFGDCKFVKVHDYEAEIIVELETGATVSFLTDGRYYDYPNAECILFPKGKTTWEGFHRPFKDGDVLVHTQNERFIMSIYKSNEIGIIINTHAIFWDREEGLSVGMQICCYTDSTRFATEEEKEILFQAIKDNGYKWNSETNTLEKLNKDKFDITTLKPFDKVLVRQNVNGKWGIDFFGFYTEGYYYTTGSCIYVQCIPYEENKHLIGTTNNCDEYYKTWE